MPDGPTRHAVALRYRPDRRAAPEVVAAGAGHIADELLARARAAGVPVREDPALLDALRVLDQGAVIPEALYASVAEVLVWAVALDRRARPTRATSSD